MTTSADKVRTRLLQILSNGLFYSGEALGSELGMSRAAISNHIKVLTSLGLDIYSVTGKGYRLAKPLDMLDQKAIVGSIKQLAQNMVEVLNVVDSTNQYVKDKKGELPKGFVCLAEAQTAGRGRHGRQWVSPYGASLYLSMHWHFTGGYSVLGGLSLAIGVAIESTLDKAGIHGIKLKWPNDIYAQGKKLAGVLIEVEGHMGAGCDCVIGIGLNIALPQNVENIDQPWIDLSSLEQQTINRNKLAAILIDELHQTLNLFEQQGLSPFIQKWRELDVYANKNIKLVMGHKTIEGIGRGIDPSGAVLVETNQGIQAFHGGEISVRAN
ncbi:bifunctional biotin--[acetyl-CoA-carboxylase] ligase/biotin operon repressor BirA [Paraglaciecola aquimarina]|uniref:Bifunctional ligase/repressor BirA n=1 Tax=Paraglaciecola algarum TaxID=3050085 RepID=A0ABS9D4V0_9ALTE|nr:bifunctional biotin--[acetyl-CoA-carboxylase] ligase/biotin operon repressor BirA [Paraglaciecola sp. G1-23]